MHALRIRRHQTLRIEIALERQARGDVIEQLDASDFDDAVTVRRIEARGFRIDNNLPHSAPHRRARNVDTIVFTCSKAWSNP